MYIEIKENKLTSWCDAPYLDYQWVDVDFSTFDPEKYKIINGILTDISESEEYLTKISTREKEINNLNLKKQIEELDKKRIRALCEPTLKNEPEGTTWLEFYTSQIQELRKQIQE